MFFPRGDPIEKHPVRDVVRYGESRDDTFPNMGQYAQTTGDVVPPTAGQGTTSFPSGDPVRTPRRGPSEEHSCGDAFRPTAGPATMSFPRRAGHDIISGILYGRQQSLRTWRCCRDRGLLRARGLERCLLRHEAAADCVYSTCDRHTESISGLDVARLLCGINWPGNVRAHRRRLPKLRRQWIDKFRVVPPILVRRVHSLQEAALTCRRSLAPKRLPLPRSGSKLAAGGRTARGRSELPRRACGTPRRDPG